MGTRVAVVAIAALALLGVSSIPAGANNCPAGRACIWSGQNYLTHSNPNGYLVFANFVSNYGIYTYPGTTVSGANSATSVSNKTTQTAYFFKNTGCTGSSVSLASYTGDGNLANSTGHAPPGFGDQIESGARSGALSSC